MNISDIFNTFGSWGVVVIALFWMAKFSASQIDAARSERQTEAELHKQEVSALSDVIQKNTDAITKLTAYITKEVDTHE